MSAPMGGDVVDALASRSADNSRSIQLSYRRRTSSLCTAKVTRRTRSVEADSRDWPGPAAFGHDGFGGSATCADPEAGLAMAYVMNRMGMNLVDDPRKMALLDAVYASVR